MKPLKLKFKGINSFSEQTEIDFEKLTRNGIFGIFGDTGSGKSTILDCINFALYGKVERSKEKLDIINYNSDVAEVKFEFDVLTDGKRKKYTVERNLKKKSGVHKAMLYEDDNCIADNASTVTKKITQVLGVDAEDFRKCIALPQGEFSQFVKSQPSERISLIERLFSLYKYGDRLKERIKSREGQAEIDYRTIKAKLETYGDVSPDGIKEFEELIAKSKAQIEKLSKESENCDKEYTGLKLLGDRASELGAAKKRLSELEARKSEMDGLKTGLKAVPVCKSVVEADEELAAKTKALEGIEGELDELNKQIENDKSEQAENFDGKIEECVALSAKYAACAGKPEKIAELEKQLEGKRREYRAKDEAIAKAKKMLLSAEQAVKEIENKLLSLGAEDLEKLINIDFKGALLKDEYVSVLDYYVGLNGQVNFHKDNSELYEFISKELKRQIEIYRDRVYNVKEFNLKQAEDKLKNFRTSNKAKEELNAELNKRNAALNNFKTDVDSLAREINIILRDGEELKKQSEEIKSELKKVFGVSENYSKIIKDNELALEKLKAEKAKLAEKQEAANARLVKQAAKTAEKTAAEKSVNAMRESYKLLLEKSGFSDLASCKKLVEEFSAFDDAEKALEEYSSELISVSSKIAELDKIKGIHEFSEGALTAAEERKKTVAAELVGEREKLAVYASDLNGAKSRLSEKLELQKELATAEKERNLVAQLKELTKGNKFMEYIANEYLCDISSLASSTLLNLTDGRYYLTYGDNFKACDNFNCGEPRGVNTLSGGETFLVSLSLALALSQTICASLKSIEFFFLDEGFGTLDSALVDTVMNALEKLKGSNFTIGIISHVEELKHRIESKITVNKATESHGSTVQMSC